MRFPGNRIALVHGWRLHEEDDVRIAAVEKRRYSLPLDPPFRAAWDPLHRRRIDATIVIVRSDDGLEGYGSGDHAPPVDLLERILVGVDPFETEQVHELCEAVTFHGLRAWTAEIACWDLVGRALDQPLWKLLGGDRDRLQAYASTGEIVAADERVARVRALRDLGIRAVKLRLDPRDWRPGLEVVAGVRSAVGSSIELMVDANQGWRMPGDRTPYWNLATATDCARELEQLGVYWLEEPLRSDDVDTYASLHKRTQIRLAAGEMVRSQIEARALIERGDIDVVQPDAALVGGIVGCRQIAEFAESRGRMYSPHTWTNGFGFLANLHVALAVSTCPYIEVPFDPPSWDSVRASWPLPAPVEITDDGAIAPPRGPGLGAVPDLESLEEYRLA